MKFVARDEQTWRTLAESDLEQYASAFGEALRYPKMMIEDLRADDVLYDSPLDALPMPWSVMREILFSLPSSQIKSPMRFFVVRFEENEGEDVSKILGDRESLRTIDLDGALEVLAQVEGLLEHSGRMIGVFIIEPSMFAVER